MSGVTDAHASRLVLQSFDSGDAPWRARPGLEANHDLHVSVPVPSRAPHASGIAGHQTSAPYWAMTVHGIRLSHPARTWRDLATEMPLDHLVAAGDFLIHWRHPLVTVDELLLAMATATNRRGFARATLALPLLDDRAESAPESLLRVLLLGNGFTGLVINRHVDDRFGEFVARTDVGIPSLGIVLEYMGDYHRTTKGQWRADMTRRARLEATGTRVMEVNADDLRDPNELVSRIRQLASLPSIVSR